MATAPVAAAQADGWTAATLHASPPFFPVSAGTSLNPKGLLSTTAAWKRAQQQGVEDARRALRPDTRTPFASFEDAAQRLLPYHVFATEEGDEQDTDELATLPGSDVLVSRAAQWQDMCVRKAQDFRAAGVRQGALIDEYEAGRVNQGALRPEEHFTVARMIYEETRSRQGPGKPH